MVISTRPTLPAPSSQAERRSPGDPRRAWLRQARTLLDCGPCAPAHEYALVQLTAWRQQNPSSPADPWLLAGVLALLALCDRRTSLLDVLDQYADLLPAVGAPGRDRAIAAVIDAVSDPRARAVHRPGCQFRDQRSRLRWDQVRARIRQLEYLSHLPQAGRPGGRNG
jgi:hypothetical protein